MKGHFNYLTLCFLLGLISCNPKQADKLVQDTGPAIELAARPPMGWNSWNCFGVTVTEEQVKQNAQYMAANLKDYGWEYVVVDLGWYLPPEINTANFKQERPAQNTDAYGRLLPDTLKFPSARRGAGFKPLADYVHSLGLKFGIHIMRGLPWQGHENGMRVKGTDIPIASFSNPSDKCNWYNGMYGVDLSKSGGQDYYNSIIELYTSWGVDFIKADDMSFPYHEAEIAALHNAIELHGNKIVLSLSPGAAPLARIAHLQDNANMWRISPDFWDHWKFLQRQFELCNAWSSHGGPGNWPDADMLPLGKLRVTGPDDYVAEHMGMKPAEITNEYSRFTDNEKYTLMTLWSIFRSPLMMGGHLPENDSLTLRLLTNKEVLAVNQTSSGNRQIISDAGLIVWVADAPDGSKYFAFFNTNDKGGAPIEVPLDSLRHGVRSGTVRDLWAQKDLGVFSSKFTADIPAHGAGLFRLSPQ